jgi:hypothetical protein
MTISKKLLFLGVVALFAASFAAVGVTKALTVPAPDQLKAQVLGASISCANTYDINGDGIVNSMDLAVVLSHMGQNYASAELDGNSVVDNQDVTLLTSCWFATR